MAKRLSNSSSSSPSQLPVVRQTAVTGWTGMGTASATATLGATPSVGNLLVFTFTCLRGGSAPLIQPTGTTLYGQIFSTITLGGNEVQLGLAYRTVMGGDSASWVIDSSDTGAVSYGYGMCVREIAPRPGHTLFSSATSRRSQEGSREAMHRPERQVSRTVIPPSRSVVEWASRTRAGARRA